MMQQPGEKPVTLEAVMGLLRDGALRRFRIDIETDSTVVGDESQEKKDRTEFIASMTQMVQAWGPIVAGAPPMLPLFGQLATFGVRAFRVGRELEETIEDTLERMEELLNAPKPPPPEAMDAENEKALKALELEHETRKAELSLRTAEQQAQLDLIKQQTEIQLSANAKMIEQEFASRAMAAKEQSAAMEAGNEAVEAEPVEDNSAVLSSLLEQNQQITMAAIQAMAMASAPKRVIRGPDGRVEGVETVTDAQQNVAG